MPDCLLSTITAAGRGSARHCAALLILHVAAGLTWPLALALIIGLFVVPLIATLMAAPILTSG